MDGLPISPSASSSPSRGMRMRPPPLPNGMGMGMGMGSSSFNPPQQQGEEDENKNENQKKKKRRLPSPRELIGHYESQGMNTEEASLKVIEELQNVLFRVVSSRSSSSSSSSSSLELINSRLLVKLEKKLDSKPGYAHTLAIGVASGAVVQGIGHLASAFSHIWNSVSTTTNPK